jgi:hypothetical protein
MVDTPMFLGPYGTIKMVGARFFGLLATNTGWVAESRKKMNFFNV